MKNLLTATAISLVLLGSIPHPAFADAETEALRAEVKALEARLAQLEKREKTPLKPEVAARYAPSAGGDKKIDQRLAIVERNQELAQEDAKSRAETTPKIEVGPKGVSITSPDKQYSINLRGYAQFDNRTFIDNSTSSPTNTFLLRSARPLVDAKMTDYFNARFMMDFGRGQTTLLDFYGDFHPVPGNDLINLRFGEFKVPIGLERWQSEQEILFVERGQTTNLVPYRDIGVMAYGQLIPDQFEYHVGVTNGGNDLQANTGDSDNNKDVVGRVFARPFRWSGASYLDGVGIGLGGTYGVHRGTSTAGSSNLVTGYATPGQRTYFSYNTGAFANGVQWRLNPQGWYYNGPFSLLGEYVINNQEVRTGATSRKLKNDAWEGIVTYVVTGEDANFDGVKPAHNFNPSAGDWGAFEVLGRMSKLNVDRDAFPLFASATTSSRSAFEKMAGVTWYLNPSVKLNLDFALTSFDGGAPAGRDHEDEKAVLTRAQFRF